jgi:putative phosphoesterase
MRIGVISDTHIPVAAKKLPDHVLALLQGADLILHAGDILELSVLDELEKIARTKAVRGNMDHADVMESLPSKQILEIGRFKIGLIHGWGPPQGLIERLKKEFTKVDCVVFGHSHSPLVERINETIFFNPGSPTDKVFTPYNSLGFLELNDEIKPEIIRL